MSSEHQLHELNNQAIILRILNVIARADGFVSSEEEKLLDILLERYKLKGVTLNPSINSESIDRLEDLASELTDHADRCLAAKLAYMVAAVSKNSDEEEQINSDEKKAYRQLTEALDLSLEELNSIEWAAKKELDTKPSLWQILSLSFGGGYENWPELTLLSAQSPGLFI